MDKAVAQTMDDLDDAVQVSYCKLYNDRKYLEAMTLVETAGKVVLDRWSGSDDLDVVQRATDLATKFLKLAEKASKEVVSNEVH
jgi:hypothetical protein